MKNKIKVIIALALILVGVVAFFALNDKNKKDDQNASNTNKLQEFNFALDYTPNTNHTGIYTALKKGWYKDEGIDLKILPYSSSVPTDKLVASKKADAGIGFTEGVVSSAGAGTPVVSIASVIAHNTSVIIARKDAGITTPKDLDGKTYGGYGAPYEKPVMTQVIKNAGGKGEYKEVVVDTGPIEALESKQVDFAWVYEGWEGIQAEQLGLDVVKFQLTDFGIPDYATPNIITSPETIDQKKELLQKFMRATAKGYEYARQNPDETAQILIDSVDPGTFANNDLVFKSQKYLSERYQDTDKKWGVTDASFWEMYPQFMLDNKAVLDADGNPVQSIDFPSLFTNQFVE